MLILVVFLISTTLLLLILVARQWHYILKTHVSQECIAKNVKYYQIAKLKLMIVEWLLNIALIVYWLFAGELKAFEKVFISSVDWLNGLIFFSVIFLSQQMLQLIVNFLRIFFIEHKYGFSHMSINNFIIISIKELILRSVIFVALISLILFIYPKTALWWFWISLSIISGILFYQYIYPSFIAPLFHDFSKLEDPILELKIHTLLRKHGFSCKDIYVMNQSRYAKQGNAYVTGLGKIKRIILFDTLFNTLTKDEIEAVIAHELGHLVSHHVIKFILLLNLSTVIIFAAIGWFMSDTFWHYHFQMIETAFGALGMIYILLPVFNFIGSPLKNTLLRHAEYSADNFARGAGFAGSLSSALMRLASQNAALIKADRWFMTWFYSHPEIDLRVKALQKKI